MQLSTFSANKLLVWVFSLMFSKKTWKVLFIIISLGSMVGCYTLLREKYTFRCAASTGIGITKQDCGEFAQLNFYRSEYYRLSANDNNNDILGSN